MLKKFSISLVVYFTTMFLVMGYCNHRSTGKEKTDTAVAAVEQQQYKVKSYYSSSSRFFVREVRPVNEIPGMQMVFVSRRQGGTAEYKFLVPTSTVFEINEEVKPVAVEYDQNKVTRGSYHTILKKK